MAGARIIPLVAGNWKMNGLAASRSEFAKIIAGAGTLAGSADLLICPPATLIADFASAARGSGVTIGGQDCHTEASGAHTGDISAEMLADAGANAVIVGHSERRVDHHETDGQVRAKAQAALRAGLTSTPRNCERKATKPIAAPTNRIAMAPTTAARSHPRGTAATALGVLSSCCKSISGRRSSY